VASVKLQESAGVSFSLSFLIQVLSESVTVLMRAAFHSLLILPHSSLDPVIAPAAFAFPKMSSGPPASGVMSLAFVSVNLFGVASSDASLTRRFK
jgi:hypothetical protein